MKIKVKEYNNAFEKKNIYLYKVKLELKNKEEEIKIKLNYDGAKLISQNDYIINIGQQLFIYLESFEYDSYVNFLKTKNDFIEKKYRLSFLQKFTIFKTYLLLLNNKNLIPFLIDETSKIIVKNEEIDMEFLLVLFIYLINSKKKFNELPIKSKEIFESIILNIKKGKWQYFLLKKFP